MLSNSEDIGRFVAVNFLSTHLGVFQFPKQQELAARREFDELQNAYVTNNMQQYFGTISGSIGWSYKLDRETYQLRMMGSYMESSELDQSSVSRQQTS